MSQVLTASRNQMDQRTRSRDGYAVNRDPRESSIYKPSKTPQISDDEEASFVNRYIIVMLILAVAPLIALQLVVFFQPELLLVPITPN